MNPDFEFLADRLRTLAAAGRSRDLQARSHDGVYLIADDGTKLINFGGNDYLGLVADRQRLRSTASAATGSGASALVSGWTDRHQKLADQIARFEGTEAAVLFPTGYAACSGTVATLADADDLILSDTLNHASLIDGCRLSKAQRIIYPHGQWESVDRVLSQRRAEFNHVWIITDGVFGMDGHVAPLVQLFEIADAYDAFTIVDEAHGTGVLGDGGQGACQELGVKQRVDVTIGTLSKSIGAQGGFVAGSKLLVDYLINRCRTLIYSTSLAPGQVEAALDGLQMVIDHPERRMRVQDLARRFRNRLSFNTTDTEAKVPIIPVVLGDDEKTVRASERLAELGFFVPAIRPPTVPEGTGRLRVSLSAAHDQEMVDSLAARIAGL